MWPWRMLPVLSGVTDRGLPPLSLPADPGAPPAPHDDSTLWRVDEALWERRAPLLVVDKPRKTSGRLHTADHPLFAGIGVAVAHRHPVGDDPPEVRAEVAGA